ncbi:MAG: hypothetical protein IJX36_07280 [Thermoguttaceae bacterium]|nr:hypothetical protein [Thermoguttaceae bacterium]MBQ8363712.1 hypothetical protein [Thermoguttaceae bacterium]MBQ9126817.1 hypothetical protein [Thermoguttaceae bacterium]
MNARNNFEYFTADPFRSLQEFGPDEYRTREELSTLIPQLLNLDAWRVSYNYSLQFRAFKTWVLPVAKSRKFRYYRKRYGLATGDLFTCAYDYLILRRKLEKFNLEKPETFQRWMYKASLNSVRKFVKTFKTREEYIGVKNGKKKDRTQGEEYAEYFRFILKEKQDATFPLDSEEPELPLDDAAFEPSPERPHRPLREAFAHFQRADPVTAYAMAAHLTSKLTYDEISNVLALDLKPYVLSRQIRRGHLYILTWLFKKGCIPPKTYSAAKEALTSSRTQSSKKQ